MPRGPGRDLPGRSRAQSCVPLCLSRRNPRDHDAPRVVSTLAEPGLERFQALIAEARRNPQALYFREEVYTIDADRPELLALAVRQVQRAGGDETRWSVGSLIWDRSGGRLMTFEELFEDAEAGQALVNALFCPALRQARDAALGPGGHEDCPDDYFARLIPGSDGRISRLRLVFDPLDGPDDGRFDVEIPSLRG